MSQHLSPPAAQMTRALRARHDGWTPDRQRRFVEAFAEFGTIAAAAAAVGMSRRSVYRLRDHPAGAGFRAAIEAVQVQPVVPPGPSLIDLAMGRETVTRSRAGLGRDVTKGFGGSGAFTIDRPVAGRVLLRLLDRAEAKVAKARNRANS